VQFVGSISFEVSGASASDALMQHIHGNYEVPTQLLHLIFDAPASGDLTMQECGGGGDT